MMYKKNVVAAIKVNGQILREKGEEVVLPFGSEYTILLKNLNSTRAQVTVQIDGTDAVGTVVLNPNSSLELERFIRNGNLSQGNKFKFIERSDAVEKGRGGIKLEDGLIRVEYKMEKVQSIVTNQIVYHHYDYTHYPYWRWYPTWPNSEPIITYTSTSGSLNSAVSSSNLQINNCSLGGSIRSSNSLSSAPSSEAGVTVPGSVSNQQFVPIQNFATESVSEVLTFHLVGQRAGKIAKKAVVVNNKPVCVTCKKVNKGTASYCGRCGTALEII